MAHTAKIIEVKSLSDGALSIKARCCDDPTTESCRTVYGLESHTEATLDAEASAHCAEVQRKHVIRETAVAYLKAKLSP